MLAVKPHQVHAEERLPLQRSHGLSRRLNISEYDVRLSSHLHRLQRHDVQNGTVRGEEDVQRASEVGLPDLRGEIGYVQPARR